MAKVKTRRGLIEMIRRLAAERRSASKRLHASESALREALLRGYAEFDLSAIELAEISGLQRANVYDWLRREKGYTPKRKRRTG